MLKCKMVQGGDKVQLPFIRKKIYSLKLPNIELFFPALASHVKMWGFQTSLISATNHEVDTDYVVKIMFLQGSIIFDVILQMNYNCT